MILSKWINIDDLAKIKGTLQSLLVFFFFYYYRKFSQRDYFGVTLGHTVYMHRYMKLYMWMVAQGTLTVCQN